MAADWVVRRAGDAVAFVRQSVGEYWTYLGMTQSADNDIERLLAMVETQAQDAAEILRKRVSLEGLIYLSNSVLLPSALYRLKPSHATCEQIDRVQSPVRRVLAKRRG